MSAKTWLVALAIATTMVPAAGSAQDVTHADVITACYVPGPGILYRTGVDGESAECRSGSDIPLRWTGPVDLATLQARISMVCDDGSGVRAIGADGSVVCESDDDTAAEVDFTSFQARVLEPCPAGTALRRVNGDGSAVCVSDAVPDIASLQVRVQVACPESSSIRAIDEQGNVTCAVDAVTTLLLTGEFDVSRSDESGTSTVSMGSSEARACFLTEVEMEDIDDSYTMSDPFTIDTRWEDETAACETRIANGQWQLRARLQETDDANVWCSARCVSWTTTTP